MYNHLFKTDYDPNSGFSKARLTEEKEFAKKCFEAGRKYKESDGVIGYEYKNFEQFYSQFETVSKSG